MWKEALIEKEERKEGGLPREHQACDSSICYHIIDQRQRRSKRPGERLVSRTGKYPFLLPSLPPSVRPALHAKEVEGCMAVIFLLEMEGALHFFR